MNAKEIKKEIEQIISDKIVDFQEKTGLEVSWIEIIKESTCGFRVRNKLKTKIKLKD